MRLFVLAHSPKHTTSPRAVILVDCTSENVHFLPTREFSGHARVIKFGAYEATRRVMRSACCGVEMRRMSAFGLCITLYLEVVYLAVILVVVHFLAD